VVEALREGLQEIELRAVILIAEDQHAAGPHPIRDSRPRLGENDLVVEVPDGRCDDEVVFIERRQ
jgi:hypothetical protein